MTKTKLKKDKFLEAYMIYESLRKLSLEGHLKMITRSRLKASKSQLRHEKF